MRPGRPGRAFFAAFLSVLVACGPGPDLVDDASFQIWCGDRLCEWTLEEGDVARVSTWHDHDYGVELVGSVVVLSQDGKAGGECVRVETVSNIAASAEVVVEVDVEGDGVIDWQVPVAPSEGYQSRAYERSIDVSSESVYFIRKSGAGRAILARVRISDDCVGNTDRRPRATNSSTPGCDGFVTDGSSGARFARGATTFSGLPTTWNGCNSGNCDPAGHHGLRGERARM